MTAVLLLVLSACTSGPTAPDASVYAGTYVLVSGGRDAAVSGTIELTATGDAVRRVRYAFVRGGVSAEYVSRGRFLVNPDSSLELQLRENDGASPYTLRWPARFEGDVLVLEYPDPADGIIVERYQRADRFGVW